MCEIFIIYLWFLENSHLDFSRSIFLSDFSMGATVLLLLLFLQSVLHQEVHGEQERCSQINYDSGGDGESGATCSGIGFCRRQFNITYIRMEPYAPSGGFLLSLYILPLPSYITFSPLYISLFSLFVSLISFCLRWISL